MFKDFHLDLIALKEKYNLSKLFSLISNRGIHALFFYRLAHALYLLKIPVLPLILTRIIQIIYGIDIDYKSKVAGGTILIHGVGLVIGAGAIVKPGCIIYHQVTLGIKGSNNNDGFPIIEEGCILGAGCKILGNIVIGKGSVVGPNCVVLQSIPANSLVKPTANLVVQRQDLSLLVNK
jgi:serine O-acetyltransferase